MSIDTHSQLVFQDVSPRQPGRITLAGFTENSQGTGWPKLRQFGSYALVYVHRGQGIYRDTLAPERLIERGDLILVFPELGHRYGPASAHDGWCEFYMVFDGPLFEQWRVAGLLDPRRPVRHLKPVAYWLERLVNVAKSPQGGDDPQRWKQLCRLQEFLVDAAAADQRRRSPDEAAQEVWLAQARQLLERWPERTQERMIQATAEQLGMGYENFRKRFAQLAGIPPGRYRLIQRIERATQLLMRRELTLRQVATMVGFCDEFHLSRRFQQIMGQSPAAFRRQTLG